MCMFVRVNPFLCNEENKSKIPLALYIRLEYSGTKTTTNSNGYIVPANFGVHFLPRMKNVPKRTKMHLNKVGLTNAEFCKLRQPPISLKICCFSTSVL